LATPVTRWEDLLTDVESEGGDHSSALETESCAELSAAESLAPELLEEVAPAPIEVSLEPTPFSVTESGALAPFEDNVATQQCHSLVPCQLPPQSTPLPGHANEPRTAAMAATNYGTSQEQGSRTFSRLRSEAGQQRQRERQRLRREEHCQMRR